MKLLLGFISVSAIIGATYTQFFDYNAYQGIPNNFYPYAQLPPGQIKQQQKQKHKQQQQQQQQNPWPQPNPFYPNQAPPGHSKGKGGKGKGKAYRYNPTWQLLENQYQNFYSPQFNFKRNVHHAKPHKPKNKHFQNFYNIYDRLEPEPFAGDPNVAGASELESTNDDFDGRSVVAPGQYPHMAALGFLTTENTMDFKCGGSLISYTFVVTAAHCACQNGDTPVLVKLGIINLKDENIQTFTTQERQIAEVIVHPLYKVSLQYHDIALLKLQQPVERTRYVRPIRLWARDVIPYSHVFTMGYGSTSFAKAPTNILTELDLSVVEQTSCNEELLPNESSPQGITETQICAKDYVRNRDTCQGDSGGPLQLNLERRRKPGFKFYLVGIISYGEVCGNGSPGVYTKISSYVDWIASIVWPNEFENFGQ